MTTFGWKETMFPNIVSVRCSGINKRMCEHLGQGAEAYRRGDYVYAEAQYNRANEILQEAKDCVLFLNEYKSYVPKPLRDLPQKFELPKPPTARERAQSIGKFMRWQVLKTVIFAATLWYGLPYVWRAICTLWAYCW